MGCSSPYLVRHDDGLVDRVRCGRCLGCRVRRKQSWVGRLRMEAADHVCSRFITLTYADDPGKLDIRDMQLFLKRYRKSVGSVRYFAVGEYGDRFGRGHWHAILFGCDLPVGRESLQSIWPAGFSLVGTATSQSMGYVAGYVLKEGPPDRRPITRMSLRPGIGFPAVERFASECSKIGIPAWPSSVHIEGHRYPMTDGAIRHFHKMYLDAGGSPPASLTPEQRDALARVALFDLRSRGLRIEEKRNRRFSEISKGADRYAALPSNGSLR